MIRVRVAHVPLAAMLAALLWTGMAGAQQQQQQQQQQETPENAQELLQELQQIQARLGEIEQRALQEDEVLQERREAVLGMVENAMVEMNPDLEPKLERFRAIETEFAEAQAAGDNEKLQGLAMEAQQLQGDIQQAQAEAMEREDVAAELESYQEQLITKMQEIDPATEELIERMAAVTEELTGGAGIG